MKHRLVHCSVLWLALGAFVGAPLCTGRADDAAGSGRPARVANAGAPETGGALLCYQAALDELSEGRLATAQAVLENGIHTYGDTPELNLLLAYIMEREGKTSKARSQLARVADKSDLALNYANQLGSDAIDNGETHVRVLPAAVMRPAPRTPAGTAISLPQNDARLAGLEAVMIQMVNAERKKAGLNELAADSGLANVARAHSAEMRDLAYFAHESPTDSLRTHVERYRVVYKDTPRILAENIYRSWGSPRRIDVEDVRAAHDALMKSPGHRENIMLPQVSKIGVGIIVNANGDMWVTQMFSRP
jgi:uncharacterized protein YkwD